MTKEDVLTFLGIEELPKSAKLSNERCAALVERQSKVKDYVIARGGGIILDKCYKSPILRIIEFYPVVAEKNVILESTLLPETEWRKETIEFLVGNWMKRITMNHKTDQELVKLVKVYKKD